MNNYSEKEKKEIISRLVELLEIDSYLHNPEGIKEAGEKVKSYLSEIDLSWETIRKDGFGDFLIAKSINWDDSKPVVMLSGHIDTIFRGASQKIEVEEDKIWGHATQDMKGGIIAIIEIIKSLAQDGKLINLIFALSGAEEQGPRNPYQKTLAKLGEEADYVFVFESTMDFDPHSPFGKRSIVRTRKGLVYIDLEINGPGGHSGVLGEKELRKSTNLVAAQVMLDLEKRLANYEVGTTVNTGRIEGGTGFAVLSANSKLEIDIRYRDINDKERFLGEFKKIIAENSKDEAFKLDYKVHDVFPPMYVNSATNEFIQYLQQQLVDTYDLVVEDRGGGSEGNLIRKSSPNSIIIDGMGVKGDDQHTPTEYLYIESIFECIDFNLKAIELIYSKDL